MTIEEKINYWIGLSDNDFTVAETLLKNGHNLYSGFMCHQALEKILKAFYVKTKCDTPPFKHDLEYLAQQSEIYNMLNDEQISFLENVNPLNIEARYPNYKNKTAQYLTNEKTQSIFEQTKELLKWIKEKI